MFKNLTGGAQWSAAHLAEPVCTKEKKEKETGDGVEACRLRRTHRRRFPAATTTGRVGGGIREARGVKTQLDGVLLNGGVAWGDGGFVDCSGRAVVEDECDGTGHQSHWRGCRWVHGTLGS